MSTSTTAYRLPPLTRDLDQARARPRRARARRDRRRAAGATLARVRDALYRAAEEDRARGWNTRFIMDNPEDETNQRVWNLLERDPVFMRPRRASRTALACGALLGCRPALQHRRQHHRARRRRDDPARRPGLRAPRRGAASRGSTSPGLDDFTDENGATRIVPGSHKLNRMPGEGTAPRPSR